MNNNYISRMSELFEEIVGERSDVTPELFSNAGSECGDVCDEVSQIIADLADEKQTQKNLTKVCLSA